MTTKDIVNFVKGFGDNEEAVFYALLEKLISKEISIDEVEEAIGEESEAFPYGYPYDEARAVVCPTFLTVLSVQLDRANGNKKAFCC